MNHRSAAGSRAASPYPIHVPLHPSRLRPTGHTEDDSIKPALSSKSRTCHNGGIAFAENSDRVHLLERFRCAKRLIEDVPIGESIFSQSTLKWWPVRHMRIDLS